MIIYPKVRVVDRALVLMGQSPPSSACSESSDGLPFIQGNAEFGTRYPVPRVRCSSPTRIADAGDLLLSVRAPVGELNEATTHTVIGRGLSAIRFSLKDRRFAWHALKWSASALNQVAQGSTFAAVSRQDVESLEIPWHGASNERIAAVLDTVDEAIATIEAVIAKLKQVRAGLLQDLLTRGLDEQGRFRDPTAHPRQFQDSPLGRIPSAWEVRRLDQLVEVLDHMRVPVSGEERSMRSGNVPYYGANGLQGWIDGFLFDEPLILIAEDGGNFDDFATRPIAYRIAGKSWVNNHAHILRASDGNVLDFILLTLEHRDIRRYIAGSTRSKLTQRELRSIKIASPIAVGEQRRIAAVAANIDQRSSSEVAELAKLKLLKSGLMTDLLTGRVRVPESLFPVASG